MDLRFQMQITGEYASFTTDNISYNVIIDCSGKIKIDSIEQIVFIICREGNGGDETEKKMGFGLTINKKIFFYDMNLNLMKNTDFDDAEYSPKHIQNSRKDLYPSIKDLYLLYVAKKIDNKMVWGVYDVGTQEMIMQPLYQKVESTSAMLFSYAKFGFMQFVNPETNKKQLYHFFDKPLKNTEYKQSWIENTTLPRIGTDDNQVCLDLDGKYFSEDGKPILFPKYDAIERCGLFAKLTLNNKVGMYDFSGKEIVPIIFDKLSDEYCRSTMVLERYLAVRKNNLWGYYDSDSKKMVTEFIYLLAEPISKGVAKVKNLNNEDAFVSFTLNERDLSIRSAEMELDFKKMDKDVYLYINYRAGELKNLIAKINGGTMTKNGMLYELDIMETKISEDRKEVYKLIDAYKNKWGQSLSSKDQKYFDDCYDYFKNSQRNMLILKNKVEKAN